MIHCTPLQAPPPSVQQEIPKGQAQQFFVLQCLLSLNVKRRSSTRSQAPRLLYTDDAVSSVEASVHKLVSIYPYRYSLLHWRVPRACYLLHLRHCIMNYNRDASLQILVLNSAVHALTTAGCKAKSA